MHFWGTLSRFLPFQVFVVIILRTHKLCDLMGWWLIILFFPLTQPVMGLLLRVNTMSYSKRLSRMCGPEINKSVCLWLCVHCVCVPHSRDGLVNLVLKASTVASRNREKEKSEKERNTRRDIGLVHRCFRIPVGTLWLFFFFVLARSSRSLSHLSIGPSIQLPVRLPFGCLRFFCSSLTLVFTSSCFPFTNDRARCRSRVTSSLFKRPWFQSDAKYPA